GVQTCALPISAAEVAVVSSARTAIGTTATSKAIAAEMPNTRRRLMSAFRNSIAAGKNATSVVFPPGRQSAAPLDVASVGAPGRPQKRADLTNWDASPCAVHTGPGAWWRSHFRANRTEMAALAL